MFSEGRKKVWNLPHAHIQPADSEEIRVDFIPLGVTINEQSYSSLLRNDVRQAIRKKWP
jgi:hypothetical protein